VGIRWKIGYDKSVRFWEDWWFGNCGLATQFWDLYIITDQQNVSVADVWDGSDLKLSFRRGVNENQMQEWLNLVDIAESISYTEDCDAIIWAFDSSSKFNVQAMYIKLSALEAFSLFTLLWFGTYGFHLGFTFFLAPE